MHVNTGHHHLRERGPCASGGSAQTQRERLKSAGAPKLGPIVDFMAVSGGSAQTWRERLNSANKLTNSAGAPKLDGSAQTRRERPNSATVTMHL